MKLKGLIYAFCFVIFQQTLAQPQNISLEDIWGGTFRLEWLDALHSMNNGQQYAVLNWDKTGATTIDIYDYKTQSKAKTLVNSSQIEALKSFRSYTFSNDETKLLLVTKSYPIYRHSSLQMVYVYNTQSKTAALLSETMVQEPTFSPDGSKVAYVYNNNIYIKDLSSSEVTQVTFDGEKNKIINGITDWVYEEEFAFVRAFEWNNDGTKIAFIKFDETQVPEFSMDVYGNALYQRQDVFKYPKAGEANSKVSLHLYDLTTQKHTELKPPKAYSDFYIPRIKWTNDTNILSAQYLNRHQNNLDLWMVNTTTNTFNLAFAETDAAYIDITDNLTFLEDNSFIWTSEKDGYNHIYHYAIDGTLINQVTQGNWDVTNYHGYNNKAKTIYYQSVENGSINRDVYAVKLNGKGKKRLTSQTGTNAAAFSADYTYFINTFSNATTPTQYTLNDSRTGQQLSKIKDNTKLLNKLKDYQISPKEFSTISVNGNSLNMWMVKPANFDETKQYPLFLYQYSGPGSQQVANQWLNTNDYWFQMLAQKGYIVACVDGRGTGFKGATFKKVTQLELGKYEVEDQIAAAKQLGNLPYIDANRIGIFGWSYGGFMSSNCLFKGNDTFAMAIAVAPVTSWRFYDTVYTERYMTTPQENPSGYDDNSPLSHVNKLKGDFLLIHGTADDNVHVQNSMRLVAALVQANKQFEWFVYPDKNHGIYGGNTRLHLYTKMTDFIDKTLGVKPTNKQ